MTEEEQLGMPPLEFMRSAERRLGWKRTVRGSGRAAFVALHT